MKRCCRFSALERPKRSGLLELIAKPDMNRVKRKPLLGLCKTTARSKSKWDILKRQLSKTKISNEEVKFCP